MHAMMRIKPRRLMSHVNRPRHDIHDMARHDMTLHDMTWLAWHGMAWKSLALCMLEATGLT